MMKTNKGNLRNKKLKDYLNCGIAPLICAASFLIPLYGVADSEEEQLVRIAKRLKPITDQQWNEITSSHAGQVQDTYEVQKGDNLWNISKSLFGNPFYWPKVWTLNNGHIGNPHLIEPGQKLGFHSGSSESLPALANADGQTMSEAVKTNTEQAVKQEEIASVLHEYDKLSPEAYAPEDGVPIGYDDTALLDRELRLNVGQKRNLRVPFIANDSTIPSLGEVIASRREGANLSQGETVYVRSNGQDLQVGSSYSVLSAAQELIHKKSDRSGFSYMALAQIKIIAVKDNLYTAEIEKSYDILKRGDKIFPLLPVIDEIKPLAAKLGVEGMVLMDSRYHGTNSSQYRFVYFDRGLEDGIELGNVFRIYEYHDPVTGKKITNSDYLSVADVMVVHATAQYSTGLILSSKNTISRGDFGVLLTDVSGINNSENGELTDREKFVDQELDELDKLDKRSGEGIGRKEEDELKQLDQWDKTKDMLPDTQSPNGQPGHLDDAKPSEEKLEPLESLESIDSRTESNSPVMPLSGTDQLEPLEPMTQGNEGGSNADSTGSTPELSDGNLDQSKGAVPGAPDNGNSSGKTSAPDSAKEPTGEGFVPIESTEKY